MFRRGGDAGRKLGINLKFGRKRPDEVRAFDGNEFRYLLHRQFALAARHQFGDAAGWTDDDLAAHYVGNAEPIEQRLESFSAGAIARAHDRFYRQQRMPKGVDRADFRLGRAIAHRYAKPATGKISTSLAQDHALPRQLVDCRLRDDRDVERRAAIDLAPD